MVTLTKPLFSVWDFTFSGRDVRKIRVMPDVIKVTRNRN
jgi:hypothetical protein